MMIDLDHSLVWLIGDPHLGRRFETGVPLHRRGEREAGQLVRFREELVTSCDINIMVGDLFDHPQVALSIILEAAEAYLAAADAMPDTAFYAMAGNHDRSRQLGSIGAWEVFARLIKGQRKNLFVVDTPGKVETIAFFPWQWGVTAAEQVEARFPKSDGEIDLAVGHWDLHSFGGNDDHLAPTALLHERFPRVRELVSGHYHLEGNWPVGDHDVRCTGSLEPYSHAEDPDGELYVTLTLAEAAAADPDDLHGKHVRVLLHEGEELPELDCLALTGKRVTADDETESVAEKLGAFDWQAILDECLKDVPQDVREFIDERLQNA